MTVLKEDLFVGSMLTISTGCYSDYMVYGVYKVLKPFNLEEQEKFFNRLREPSSRNYGQNEFVEMLVAGGVLAKIPAPDLFLGGYEFKPRMDWEGV